MAISRSIGDVDFANAGIIPNQDVTVIDLQQFWSEHDILDEDNEEDGNNGSNSSGGTPVTWRKKVFVVLGSDGLFHARKVEYMAQHVCLNGGRDGDSVWPRSYTKEVLGAHVGHELVDMGVC